MSTDRKSEKDTAKDLNEFFSNAFNDLNIPQFNQIDQTSESISDAIIKATAKYRTHCNLILNFRLLKK